MKRIHASLLLTCSIFFLSACSKEVVWAEYTSKSGEYSVLMPGTPTDQIGKGFFSDKVGAGQHLGLSEMGVVYTVRYEDVPEMESQVEPKELLRMFKRSVVEVLECSVKKDKEIMLGGSPGVELELSKEFKGKNGPISSSAVLRFYLVRNRFYYLLCEMGSSDLERKQGDVSKFMDSFRSTR